MSPRPRRAYRLATVLAGALLLGTGGPPLAVGAPDTPTSPVDETAPGLYLVTLTGHGTASHPLTRPAPGRRLDRDRPAVRDLVRRLRERQDRVLASVGDPTVLHRWTTALNGFAARLGTIQVKSLRADARVALVERSTVQRTASDIAAPLGLAPPWLRLQTPADAGDGIVVGLVDTGIWPENPAFAGLPQQERGRSVELPGFRGACAEAERWAADDCNDKIVSARWFVDGFGADRVAAHELLSPRDVTGHGSHTASTVAGEAGVDVRIGPHRFGPSAGVAPGARLAVYKACWAAPDPADDGCATADTVTAVDRAVADGVDVLTYAVTGSSDPRDTVSRAFLGAAQAGVFVAAAAGNDGPGPATVDHAAPWVTTVGAATHRTYAGGVRLDDGTVLEGTMVSDRRVEDALLVHGRDLAAAGASPQEAARCETGSLDAARAAGVVVVCDRGRVPRVDKSAAVAAAGGAGMVLADTEPDSVEADVHAVPSVHLSVDEARRLRTLLRTDEAPRVTLRPGVDRAPPEPRLSWHSARGPVPAAEVLKPDLVAPGASVLGAVAPLAPDGSLWDLRSGTSVGAAHVAGLAALVASRHDSWDASRIRSALTTTADPLAGSGGPTAEGAGHVDPGQLLDPGLVLQASGWSYRRFLDGELAGRDLNTPSVVVEDLVGETVATRRLTNVGGTPGSYSARVEGLEGFDVVVRPRAFTLSSGQTRRVRIVLRPTPEASVRRHTTGSITFTGLRHAVRLPVVLRAAAVQAPDVVRAEVGDRRVTVRGRSGTGRPARPVVVGLAGAAPTGLSLRPGSFVEDGDLFVTDVSVPSGAAAARFEVRSHNLADDLDLRVHRDGAVVAESTGSASSAVVTLVDPRPGDYRVEVQAARAGNGAVATGELTSWVVGAGGAGTLELGAQSTGAGPGSRFRYAVRWPDLDPTRRWLGVVRYPGSGELTLLRLG